jgi:transposase
MVIDFTMPTTPRRKSPVLTAKRDRSEMAERRRRALELIDAGETQQDVAKKVGASQQAVSKWVKAHRAGGEDALESKGKPGPKTGLTDEQRQQVEAALIAGPKSHGYRNELWTLARMAAVIAKVTGREAPSTTSTWNLMQEMKWSSQRPARRAREQKADAVKEFRERTWVAVKKTPNDMGK